jgi:hypothetical protein
MPQRRFLDQNLIKTLSHFKTLELKQIFKAKPRHKSANYTRSCGTGDDNLTISTSFKRKPSLIQIDEDLCVKIGD